MTREEIEKFSRVEPYSFETDREEDWYKIGCLDGLEAADAAPDTSSLWHDAREEPKKEERILLEIVIPLQEKNEVNYFVESTEVWLKCIMKASGLHGLQCRWAYISDLLPKKN